MRRPPISPLFPTPPLFQSHARHDLARDEVQVRCQRVALGCERVTHRSGLRRDGGGDCLVGAVEAISEVRTALLQLGQDRKSTRLNSSHANISYAVFCLKKK